MRNVRAIGIIIGCLIAGICSAHTIKPFQVSLPFTYHPPIIGVMMPSGDLSDAIVQQLSHYCTDVIQPTKMHSIMRNKQIAQGNYLAPSNLVRLKDYPIDAILDVEYTGQVYNLPEVAKFTLRSALTGRPLAHVDWFYWAYKYPNREKMDRRIIADNIIHQLFAQAKSQTDWGI